MPHPYRCLFGKETRYPLHRRLGGPQGRSGRVRKISPSPGFDPWTIQLVASRYTDRPIPVRDQYVLKRINGPYVPRTQHVYIYMCVCVCVCVCVYIYIYIYANDINAATYFIHLINHLEAIWIYVCIVYSLKVEISLEKI
jgi:hypothetical protein